MYVPEIVHTIYFRYTLKVQSNLNSPFRLSILVDALAGVITISRAK
jgi:hypothetical protein